MLRFSTIPEIRAAENKLFLAILDFDQRREYINYVTASAVKKYGKPVYYMGNLFHTKGMVWETVVSQSRKLPTADRCKFLEEKIKKIPSLPSSIFFIYPGLDVVFLGDKELTFQHILDFRFYSKSDNCPAFFKIEHCSKNFGSRIMKEYISVGNEEERIEAEELLKCTKEGRMPNIPPKSVSANQKIETFDGHPSFFGISLFHKREEMINLLRQRGFIFTCISKGPSTFYGKILDVKFNFNLCADKKTGIVYGIWGYSEYFEGYESIRQHYDSIVDYMRETYGPLGMKKKDLPRNIRKNSIMKNLRECTLEISTSYIWPNTEAFPSGKPTHIKLEISADEFCLKQGNLFFEVYDAGNVKAFNN